MQIIQKTPSQLIIKYSPIGIWIIHTLLIMAGATLLAIPASSPEESLGTQITAYALIVWGGILLFTSFRSILWVFDKSDNSFLAEYEKLLTTKTSKYDLIEIKYIQIESKSDGEGTETFGI